MVASSLSVEGHVGLNEMPSREGGKEGEFSCHDGGRDDHGQLACMRT